MIEQRKWVFIINKVRVQDEVAWVSFLSQLSSQIRSLIGGDMTWERKLFPRYWPFVKGIHRSPMGWESS